MHSVTATLLGGHRLHTVRAGGRRSPPCGHQPGCAMISLMRQLVVVAGLAACMLGVPSAARCARIEPTAATLKSVEALRARSMGVDRAGNLWAWDPQLQTVTFLAPSGDRLPSY